MIEINRRKEDRWVAKPGLLLEYRATRRIPILKGRYRLFGIVLDLSLGGMAVEYTDRKLRPAGKIEYALSAPDHRLRLEGIHMTPVSDFVLVDETACGGSICRRRGFRFGPMTPAQQEILQKILYNCAEVRLSN